MPASGPSWRAAAPRPAHDFRTNGPALHSVPGVIQLFGIESPGPTASLTIADHAAALAA